MESRTGDGNALETRVPEIKGILEAMEDGVCIISREHAIEYVNPSVLREFGPVEGRPCYEYFHGEKGVCPSCRYSEVIAGKSIRWEWLNPKTAKTYDLFDIPLQDATGRIAKLEIFHDVTARKQAEQDWRESEKRYRILVETMHDGLVQGENGVITYVNDRLCDLIGYSREELVDRPIAGFLAKESQAMLPERTERIKRGDIETFDMLWVRRDGQEVYTVVSPKPVVDDKGQFKGCFAVIHDITERKRAEDELKRSYEQVRNLSAHLQSVRETERTNIAREIHDELGQALTALKMDLSWTGGKLRRDQKALHGKIQSMLTLVDKTIKTVKRISSELRPGVLDDLGLTAAIEWQARQFRKRTGIPCDVAVHPPTINPDKEHSTALFRIFQEALTNVARHAGATKVLAQIEENDGEIILTVADNGKGITRRQIASSKSFGIMGIRERVNYFGGEVKIAGSPKKGTALQVTIPRGKTKNALSASSAGGEKSSDRSAL